MAGPWLATHIWEYYDYTRDKKFLKEVGYDLIKSSANFAVDYLWHKPDGTYTAAPSTSPEHGPVDQGATFVHAVIREILLNAIDASKALGVDSKDRKQWQYVLKHLVPYQIGRYGQLMEWSTDIDDPTDEHRHVNHLFGLHPGHTLSPITTPELTNAAKVVLEHRGDGATGWSMGWKLNQWARLQDGNHAYKLFGNLLKMELWTTYGIPIRLSRLTVTLAELPVSQKCCCKVTWDSSNYSQPCQTHGKKVLSRGCVPKVTLKLTLSGRMEN